MGMNESFKPFTRLNSFNTLVLDNLQNSGLKRYLKAVLRLKHDGMGGK